MSLSDVERYEQLTVRVDKIWRLGFDILHELKRQHVHVAHRDVIKRLALHARKVLGAFYGSVTNATFWLFGGDVTNNITQSDNPLHCAILHRIEDSKPDPNAMHMSDHTREFYHEDSLTMYRLVKDHDALFGAILALYGEVEHCIYALRRYDDSFRRRYRVLDRVVSELYGQCYYVFRYHEIFAHCYLIADISARLLRNKQFNEIIKKFQLYHDIRYMLERTFADLLAMHLEVHRLDVPDLNTCVQVFLRLAGRRYHYDHKYKELRAELASKHDIDWLAADKQFTQNKLEHACKDKQELDTYQTTYNHLGLLHDYQDIEAIWPEGKPADKVAAKKTSKAKKH